MHHERVGQPHSQQIDWKIAALNGLGMLLFFVPGAAAFAVDFYTGAIYLPSDDYYPPGELPYEPSGQPPGEPVVVPPRMVPENLPSPPPGTNGSPGPMLQPAAAPPPRVDAQLPPPPQPLGLRRVVVPRDQLRPPVLEELVSRHVGRPVSLADQQARLSVLPRIDQFHEQARRHASDRSFGFAVRSFFERFQRA
jgi:hypothetical protein